MILMSLVLSELSMVHLTNSEAEMWFVLIKIGAQFSDGANPSSDSMSLTQSALPTLCVVIV